MKKYIFICPYCGKEDYPILRFDEEINDVRAWCYECDNETFKAKLTQESANKHLDMAERYSLSNDLHRAYVAYLPSHLIVDQDTDRVLMCVEEVSQGDDFDPKHWVELETVKEVITKEKSERAKRLLT